MPRTKESGIETRLQLNGDFRDGYWAGVEATKAERDALREALEKIAAYWQPHSGVNDILDSIAEIARAALDRRP